MGVWFRYYVRKYLRNWMKPINQDLAQVWHKRLTYAYIFLAFNAFGLSYYRYNEGKKTGKIFEDKSNAHYWARTLRLQNPIIYRISPSKGIERFEMTAEDFPDGNLPSGMPSHLTEKAAKLTPPAEDEALL